MKLYLVRHGETAGNIQHRYVGWQDPPLTRHGLRQAEALARALASEPVTAVYSSDLTRAQQTARPIAACLDLPVQTRMALREVSFGQWDGLTYDEIQARDPAHLEAWLADPERVAPPGGETLAQLRARLLTALPIAEGALLVTHGGPIRTLVAHFTGRPFWDLQVPPGSVTVLVEGKVTSLPNVPA
ncbi:MAG TPA: histidine phosphatase family protein [Symbiobacteriaceae bacterium]|nr:histidine phosphatase family protein [Symbiobacteriaceae bacterium]